MRCSYVSILRIVAQSCLPAAHLHINGKCAFTIEAWHCKEMSSVFQEWEKRQAQWKSTLQKIRFRGASSRRFDSTFS